MGKDLVPGDRVFVAVGIDGRRLNLIGVGTYRGEEVPDAGIPGAPTYAHDKNKACGRVDLDDGGVVYRCEAWFLPEADLATDRRKVYPVSLVDLRARARGNAPMRRRTNQKGPDQNTTLVDGEVQFEPGNFLPSGYARDLHEPGISVWCPTPDDFDVCCNRPRGFGLLGGRRCMMRLNIAPRGSRKSASAYLSKTELGELLAHLTEVHASMEDVP